MFNYSNGIKRLISHFQFHDIVSSHALLRGTMYPIEEYRAVLLEDPNYGIVPLQGIAAPVYCLIGEVGNLKVQLRKQWAMIEEQVRAGGENAHELRIDYYEELEEVTEIFANIIDGVAPWQYQLDLIKLDQEECEIQMGLFDLYLYICRVQFDLSIKQVPPASPSQQLLLMKAVKLIDFLLSTKVRASLSLLLLVCGTMCVTQVDRDDMINRFRNQLNQYQIGNFQHVEELVEYAWTRNPCGIECMDCSDTRGDGSISG